MDTVDHECKQKTKQMGILPNKKPGSDTMLGSSENVRAFGHP
jgi:hypothetical protein